jgi:hypothetical protein
MVMWRCIYDWLMHEGPCFQLLHPDFILIYQCQPAKQACGPECPKPYSARKVLQLSVIKVSSLHTYGSRARAPTAIYID